MYWFPTMCVAASRAVTSFGACDSSVPPPPARHIVRCRAPEIIVVGAGSPCVAELEGIRRDPYLGGGLFEPSPAIRGVVRAEDQRSSCRLSPFFGSVQVNDCPPSTGDSHGQPTPQPPPLLDTYHPLTRLPWDRQRRWHRGKAGPWPEPEAPTWLPQLNEVPTSPTSMLYRGPQRATSAKHQTIRQETQV